MEALIDQDFEFQKFSAIYGQFLQEVHETCPDTVFTDVGRYYPYIAEKPLYIHVTIPERLAVVLKLRFGAHLRTRPIPPKVNDLMSIMQNKNSRYYSDTDCLNTFKIIDYIDIVKTYQKEVDEEQTLEQLYQEMKTKSL